jgi:hypothetical protein
VGEHALPHSVPGRQEVYNMLEDVVCELVEVVRDSIPTHPLASHARAPFGHFVEQAGAGAAGHRKTSHP